MSGWRRKYRTCVVGVCSHDFKADSAVLGANSFADAMANLNSGPTTPPSTTGNPPQHLSSPLPITAECCPFGCWSVLVDLSGSVFWQSRLCAV